MSRLDSVDADILECLQGNARLTNAKLAKRISLSETPCWRRVKLLEKAGVIEGYQAVLSRRKLGLGVLAFVQLGCSQHSREVTAEFQRIIEESPNVLSCHNTSGEADFLLVVVAKDLDDYSRFAESVLRVLPGVVKITSNLSLRELKSSGRLPVNRRDLA